MANTENDPILQKKKELRAHLKELKNGAFDQRQAGRKISEFLLSILPSKATVGAFWAKSDEPSLEHLMSRPGYRFALPRVEGEALGFYSFKLGQTMQPGSFGILEPDPNTSVKVELGAIDVLLVPGVGFDRKCRRLGRGKGYYDHTLVHYKGLKIGIGAAVQVLVEDLPVAPHDVAMDMVVTEQFILQRVVA